MAVWTNPKTFAALVGLTASELNTYLRDNLTYLKDGVDGTVFQGAQLVRSASQSLATGAATNISFDTESADVGGWWAIGDPTKVIVPAAAIVSGYTRIAVLLFSRIKYATDGTGDRRIRHNINGSSVGSRTTSALSGEQTDTDLTDFAFVSALDEITLEGYQTSGGNLNVTVSQITVLRYAPYD